MLEWHCDLILFLLTLLILSSVASGQHNELVIGNIHGELLIFKGFIADGKPWAKATELGMVGRLSFFISYCP